MRFNTWFLRDTKWFLVLEYMRLDPRFGRSLLPMQVNPSRL